MQRLFVEPCAGRYEPGDTMDQPLWWWRTQPVLWAASRPMGDVLSLVGTQLGRDVLEAAITGEPEPEAPAKRRRTAA